jgi:BioD-like phosphotransacetylase family protein
MGLVHNMKEIGLAAISAALILSLGFSAHLMMANAQGNSTPYDMKSVTDSINKSLAKLTGSNSSGLLDNTLASINKTASQIANQGKDIINEDSLNTAEIIAKKIGIGIADVLSNISGEVKQGILSK